MENMDGMARFPTKSVPRYAAENRLPHSDSAQLFSTRPKSAQAVKPDDWRDGRYIQQAGVRSGQYTGHRADWFGAARLFSGWTAA